MKEYALRLGDDIIVIKAKDKEDAYIRARLMGYNGGIKDIRLYR